MQTGAIIIINRNHQSNQMPLLCAFIFSFLFCLATDARPVGWSIGWCDAFCCMVLNAHTCNGVMWIARRNALTKHNQNCSCSDVYTHTHTTTNTNAACMIRLYRRRHRHPHPRCRRRRHRRRLSNRTRAYIFNFIQTLNTSRTLLVVNMRAHDALPSNASIIIIIIILNILLFAVLFCSLRLLGLMTMVMINVTCVFFLFLLFISKFAEGPFNCIATGSIALNACVAAIFQRECFYLNYLPLKNDHFATFKV